MKLSLFSYLAALAVGAEALSVPPSFSSNLKPDFQTLKPRQGCGEHGPTNRKCWKNDYSIDTDYYDVSKIPKGQKREYWLSVQQGECELDGFKRPCMTMNGTVPGPTIFADWGDELTIHVTNNMSHDVKTGNGTAIHWHGLRMLNNMAADGVPGVTQCPIAPNQTHTYKFQVTQYGSTWYHSHFSLQYGDGLYGGMIFNGPATADYDEDMGIMTLSDWGHTPAFTVWRQTTQVGGAAILENTLINGTNTFACNNTVGCGGVPVSGKKFEMGFEPKKSYRLRLVNTAVDAVFQFSIDGHKLKVIANDLVPIKPFDTDSITIQMGQRYDVIVQAKDVTEGNFWIRGGIAVSVRGNGVTGCGNIKPESKNDNTGILRYKAGDTGTPDSKSIVVPVKNCHDEAATAEHLVPHLALDVEHFNLDAITLEDLNGGRVPDTRNPGGPNVFQWTLNNSSLWLDWSDPTLQHIIDKKDTFPSPYNVRPIKPKGTEPEWAILVIQQKTPAPIDHPIHMHGHDFWVLAQEVGQFDLATAKFNTKNPMRRDVATLPSGGYLVIAFLLDNPGAWLVHCHIAWHASQGLSMEFVESQESIKLLQPDRDAYEETCKEWRASGPWHQDDSGI